MEHEVRGYNLDQPEISPTFSLAFILAIKYVNNQVIIF